MYREAMKQLIAWKNDPDRKPMILLQQLITHPENDIFYWSAENATAELDFLIQTDEKIVPIEAKAEENLRAKSLKMFTQKYNVKDAVRTSMSDFRKQDWMVNIPLYAIENLNSYLTLG